MAICDGDLQEPQAELEIHHCRKRHRLVAPGRAGQPPIVTAPSAAWVWMPILRWAIVIQRHAAHLRWRSAAWLWM